MAARLRSNIPCAKFSRRFIGSERSDTINILEPYDQIFSLSGKTALVAGASRGIGLSIAQALATAGAHTILAARSVDKLRECASAITAAGHSASTLELDVTKSDSIRAAGGS